MAKLISLFNYESRESELPFVVFHSTTTKRLQCVSPDLMKLTDNIYVADLSIVQSYWRQRAQKNHISTKEIIGTTLLKSFPDCKLALFCEHPFQGLVFFNHLQMFKAEGLYSSDSLFSRKSYQNMSWHPWRLSAHQINESFEKANVLNKERKHFLSQLRRFERFTERVDIKEFHGLEQAHFSEISRRFKGFIGLLWRWTFPSQNEDKSLAGEQASLFTFRHYQLLNDFPWVPFKQKEKATVQTLLEYPLSDWQSLEEVLKGNLMSLHKHYSHDPECRVVELQWQITLFDMSEVSHLIHFKYPLAWNDEQEKDYSSLMSQLHLCFEQFKNQLDEKSKELDYINTALIVGWKLSVSKSIHLNEKTRNFFDDLPQKQFIADVKSLEHKVKGNIKTFKLQDNFIPGLDFTEKAIDETWQQSGFMTTLTLVRPFYIFPDPQPLASKKIKRVQFLDRTASDWWVRHNELDSYRDCYLCELNDNSLVFAYRNYRGDWFQYGL